VKKLIYFIFFVLLSFKLNAKTNPPFSNIIEHDQPKNYKEIIFEDFEGNTINLKEYKSKIYILNFWATWCAPCKKEMPSLDKLHKNDNIEVFAINVEEKNKNKTKKFFKDLDIKNLSIYFDPELELTKSLSLRGLPTTIILNQDKKEVARIIGEVDFNDFSLLNWLLDI
jgi:thiol-disulfide isomerase/thioredoxin|tara:strand:+ start:283 stop:789 length:507 start_codon:yes stop_codon:yes gene_type:complete